MCLSPRKGTAFLDTLVKTTIKNCNGGEERHLAVAAAAAKLSTKNKAGFADHTQHAARPSPGRNPLRLEDERQ